MKIDFEIFKSIMFTDEKTKTVHTFEKFLKKEAAVPISRIADISLPLRFRSK